MSRRPMVLILGGLDHADNRRARRELVLPEDQATVEFVDDGNSVGVV